MRLRRVAVIALMLFAGMTGTAGAQSFFEKLFGLSPSAPAFSAPPRLPLPSANTMPLVLRSEAHRQSDADVPADEGRRRTGRFRAVCVRLCDGYYWPMNDRATSQSLYQIADQCRSACGTEARLFYSENDSDDAAAMMDLSGRRYDSLKTAFVYREKLISGCSCKPSPWSIAERSRHVGYALAQLQAEQAKVAAAAAEAARMEAERARVAAKAAATAAHLAVLPVERANPTGVSASIAVASARTEAPLRSDDLDGTAAQATIGPSTYIEQAAAMPTPRVAAGLHEPAPRARTIRVSHRAIEPRPRQQRVAIERPRPQRIAAVSSSGSGGLGFFPAAKSKYVWPGDRQ